MEDRFLPGLILVTIGDSRFWVRGMLVGRLQRRGEEEMITLEGGEHDLGR